MPHCYLLHYSVRLIATGNNKVKMNIIRYFKGEMSLSSSVILNIIVISLVAGFAEVLISEGKLSSVTAITSFREFWSVLIYYIAVLPFEYAVWVCARNTKKKIYFILGRLFALKHIPFIVMLIFQSI